MLSHAYLKKYTPISSSVDNDKLTPIMEVVQDLRMQAILGTVLYDKIIAAIDAGSLSGDLQQLNSDYIQPCLRHYIAADYIQISPFEVGDGGVMQRITEGGVPADGQDIQKLARSETKRGDHYRKRLIEYLCRSNTKFPEYTQTQPDGGMYPERIGGTRNFKVL